MVLGTSDLLLYARLRKLGIRVPIRMVQVCRSTGLSIPLGASILTQESGGGQNIFGHDPTIYTGAGTVTKSKYLEYRAERDRTGKAQGVGVTQLTYPGYQDEADRIGGCWVITNQLIVGFKTLAGNIRQDGLHNGVARYNGSGPAADEYARTVIARADQYAAALHLPEP